MFRRAVLLAICSLLCITSWFITRPVHPGGELQVAVARYHQRYSSRRFASRSTMSYQRSAAKPGMGNGSR